MRNKFYKGFKDPIKNELTRDKLTTLATIIKEAIKINNRNFKKQLKKQRYYTFKNYIKKYKTKILKYKEKFIGIAKCDPSSISNKIIIRLI